MKLWLPPQFNLQEIDITKLLYYYKIFKDYLFNVEPKLLRLVKLKLSLLFKIKA